MSDPVNDDVLRWVCETTGAARARRGAHVQSLWGGYGELCKVHLSGHERRSVVVKCVQPPAVSGRESDRGHRRKCRSYDVEGAFYRTFAARCDDTCRVPVLLGSRARKSEES